MLKKCNKIHFIGINGIGMSGIAKVLLGMGFSVSGSDLSSTARTRKLEELGARITQGHNMDNIDDVDLVVVSSAIPEDNVELVAAKKKNITIWQRAKMLGEIMNIKEGIAVAGAHGKTTTTSMASYLLERNGFDPTIIIGGELNDIGGNAKLGKGRFVVAEADESDGSLLYLKPKYTIVTNIESDHLDFYGGLDKIIETFRVYLNNLSEDGLAILCKDNPNIDELLPQITSKYLTYGLEKEVDVQGVDVQLKGRGSLFNVKYLGRKYGPFQLSVPGIHNVYNSLAVIGLGFQLGLADSEIADALVDFRGVQRRFQLLGEVNGIQVIDDYAHHPTEIAATLKAAKQLDFEKVICIFQPHRYTRTKFLKDEFTNAFSDADTLIITDIYSAGEKPIPGVSAELLVEGIKKNCGKEVIYLPKQDDIVTCIAKYAKPGNLILTMGAGNIYMVGEKIVRALKGENGV